LIDFTAHVLTLRKRLMPLAGRWYTGLPDANGRQDLAWLRRHGQSMSPEQWDNRMSRIMGAWIGAAGGTEGGGEGGDPLLLLFNGRDMDATFQLPPGDWVCELDTTQADGRKPSHQRWLQAPGAAPVHFELAARSVVLMRDAASTLLEVIA
jgi:glycogen debranching enzyme